MAVSYTHLDVYKRQELMRLFDVAEIDAALSYPGLIDILDDAFRSEVIAPKRGQYAIQRPDETDAILLTMPAWSGPDAVSYTHLDVYKRQHQQRRRAGGAGRIGHDALLRDQAGRGRCLSLGADVLA